MVQYLGKSDEKDILMSVQTNASIRTESAYRAVSTNALLIISKTPPINLIERCSVHRGTDRKVTNEMTQKMARRMECKQRKVYG